MIDLSTMLIRTSSPVFYNNHSPSLTKHLNKFWTRKELFLLTSSTEEMLIQDNIAKSKIYHSYYSRWSPSKMTIILTQHMWVEIKSK